MTRIVRQLIADGWPTRLLLSALLAAALWFLISAKSLQPHHLSEWRLVIGFVALSGAVLLMGLLAAIVLSALFLLPIYRHQAWLNGAPFKVGDFVRVLSGPAKGRTARIYSYWQGETFRIDLDAAAKEQFKDIFGAHQLERVSVGTTPVPFSTLRHDDEGRMFLGGEAFTGVAIDFWPDGSKASEVSFTEGVKSGVDRLWHPNGLLASEGNRVQGCAYGLHREWYPNGNLKIEEYIGDDGHVSRRVEWDQEGNITSKRVR